MSESPSPSPAPENPAPASSELFCETHGVNFLGTSPADCPLCQREAAAPSSPDATGNSTSIAENTAATAPTPAPVAPSPAPVPAHSTITTILGVIATVLGDAASFLTPGPWSMLLGLASSGVGFVAKAISSSGSANSLSEADAVSLKNQLLAGLADLSKPLPTPAELEASGS